MWMYYDVLKVYVNIYIYILLGDVHEMRCEWDMNEQHSGMGDGFQESEA